MTHLSRTSLMRLARSAVFCGGLVLMLLGADFVMRPAPATLVPWAALAETRNEADVLVFGSSHAHCTVLPMEMWRQDGVTAVDVTAGGQAIPATEAYLEQALRDESPKVVLVEVSLMGARSVFNDLPRAHANFDDMPLGVPKVQGIVESIDATAWPEFFVPLHVYHSRWQQLTSADFQPDKRSHWGFVRGALYLPMVEVQPGVVIYVARDEGEYERDLACIREMARTCERAGARMVLFVSPTWERLTVADQPLLERLEADLGGDFPSVGYLDMNPVAEAIGIDVRTDYKDKNHLNHRGAVKMSKWLSAYLVEEYDLADHRDDEMAGRWNEALSSYDRMFVPDW